MLIFGAQVIETLSYQAPNVKALMSRQQTQ